MRVGELTDDDGALLRTRITKNPFLMEDVKHIFYPNRDVNKHNKTMIKKLSKLESIKAQLQLPKGQTSIIDEKIGTILNNDFPETLTIGVGARNMMIWNVDQLDYLYIGLNGTVVGIE